MLRFGLPFILISMTRCWPAGEGVAVRFLQPLTVIVHGLNPTPLVLVVAEAIFMV